MPIQNRVSFAIIKPRNLSGEPFSFIVELGDTFAITGKLKEIDSGSVQDNFLWNDQYTAGTEFGTTDASVTTGICGGNSDISINFVVE